MSTIRRVLLGIVALLLFVDVGALAFVKVSASSEGGDEPADNAVMKVVAWLEDPIQAGTVAGAIKAEKFEVEVAEAQREKAVPSGYTLVFRASDAELLKPIAETLQHKGWSQVTVTGEQLQLGGIYPSKAKAAAVADKVQAQEGIKFEIIEGTKIVPVKSHKVVVKGLGRKEAERVVEILLENNVEDFEETQTEAG